ncbi:unannotated protein [freshwater metagenome]|jgi:hypothetical protein|uniref:Unannotated protein n=1 Tax=freshwater metagenome TaxID=449393 RepID=A0A6J6IHI7_9ZZZZ|nr:hypothetical protein [Rhodoluna sp.]MSZ20438.1 hypothetical protein [Actinomycetota bacterium]
MAKKTRKKADARSARTYISLSFVSAVFVGVIVWGNSQDIQRVAIWSGLTFIVVLVTIATLALSVKDEPADEGKPRLK